MPDYRQHSIGSMYHISVSSDPAQIKELQRQIKILRSAMKKSGDQQKDIDNRFAGRRMHTDSLTKTIKIRRNHDSMSETSSKSINSTASTPTNTSAAANSNSKRLSKNYNDQNPLYSNSTSMFTSSFFTSNPASIFKNTFFSQNSFKTSFSSSTSASTISSTETQTRTQNFDFSDVYQSASEPIITDRFVPQPKFSMNNHHTHHHYSQTTQQQRQKYNLPQNRLGAINEYENDRNTDSRDSTHSSRSNRDSLFSRLGFYSMFNHITYMSNNSPLAPGSHKKQSNKTYFSQSNKSSVSWN